MDDKRLEEIRGYLNGWTRREYERLPFHYKVLHPKTVELLTAYDAKCADLTAAREEIERLRRLMPEEPHCKGCGGMRVKDYPNTGVWTGARITGQAFTVGICNECWGSGRADRPAMNLRELLDDNKSLRTEIERLKQPTTCSCGYCDKTQAEIAALKAARREMAIELKYVCEQHAALACPAYYRRKELLARSKPYNLALSALVEPEVKDGE